jgi:hypothetical protein
VEHLQKICAHEEQAQELASLSDADFEIAAASKPAYSMLIDGKVMCCGGILAGENGAGIVWSYFAKGSAEHMKAILSQTEILFRESGFHRIEATVKENFKVGRRFIEKLGFGLSTVQDDILVLGEKYMRYERIL